VREIEGKFRLVNKGTTVVALHAKTGSPLDGQGHTNNQAAERQAGYVNQYIRKANDAESRAKKGK